MFDAELDLQPCCEVAVALMLTLPVYMSFECVTSFTLARDNLLKSQETKFSIGGSKID